MVRQRPICRRGSERLARPAHRIGPAEEGGGALVLAARLAAAAGQQVRVVTSVGEYTARLTGSVSALATYLCDNNNALYDAVYIYSPRGAEYGPFTPGAA